VRFEPSKLADGTHEGHTNTGGGVGGKR